MVSFVNGYWINQSCLCSKSFMKTQKYGLRKLLGWTVLIIWLKWLTMVNSVAFPKVSIPSDLLLKCILCRKLWTNLFLKFCELPLKIYKTLMVFWDIQAQLANQKYVTQQTEPVNICFKWMYTLVDWTLCL